MGKCLSLEEKLLADVDVGRKMLESRGRRKRMGWQV